MILVKKDAAWPVVSRKNLATGLREETAASLRDIVMDSRCEFAKRSGLLPTHLLIGYGARPHLEAEIKLHGRDVVIYPSDAPDEPEFCGLTIRWVEGNGVEILADCHQRL